MSNDVFYYGGNVPVELGDVASTRVFFFWRHEGAVVYVPGISPKHNEMEHNGLTWIGIRADDGAFIGEVVDPETRCVPKRVKFLGRSRGERKAVAPDERLFEEEDGTPR